MTRPRDEHTPYGAHPRTQTSAMELWFMSRMFCGIILHSTPAVAATLSAFPAKLDTFKRLQAADMRAYDEVSLKETKTEPWTVPHNAPPSARLLQRWLGALIWLPSCVANPPTAFNWCWSDADIRVREDVVALIALISRRFGRWAARAGLGDCGDAWSKRNKRSRTQLGMRVNPSEFDFGPWSSQDQMSKSRTSPKLDHQLLCWLLQFS